MADSWIGNQDALEGPEREQSFTYDDESSQIKEKYVDIMGNRQPEPLKPAQ